MSKIITCEQVSNGHPDKICDQIADAIVTDILQHDRHARVAIECLLKKSQLFIAGEVTTDYRPNYNQIVHDVFNRIGAEKLGWNLTELLRIGILVDKQSPDIALGVDKGGAGDQGIMYGYATNETANYMPLTVNLAQGLVRRLDRVRHDTALGRFLRPDGKSQVTMRFDDEGHPVGIHSLILSAQHSEAIGQDDLHQLLQKTVIEPVCSSWIRPDTAIRINETGRFVIGGPVGDTGLTGRKIMVDTYGTLAKHGGGAFSGKDATKVDRSAAYMARYVAKNVVAAGFCDRCEVSIAYAISGIYPEAVQIQTFCSEHIDRKLIDQAVAKTFSFAVGDIIRDLDLRRPQFRKTAVYGHFGREDQGFAWERTDKAQALRQAIR